MMNMKNVFEVLESKLLSTLFTRWVTNERDLEMLSMVQSMITTQTIKLKTKIDTTNRVVIKGYRQYETGN